MTNYTIPYANLFNLTNSIAKFNKKATKNGMENIVLSAGTSYYKRFDAGFVSMVDVKVEGNIPVINGWKLIAAVDHTPNGNIISKFPSARDVVLPEEFYTRAPFCDHCNTRKVKVHSFIIQNIESGVYMHVGSTCLTDFFNMDMSTLIGKLSFIKELDEDLNDGEYTNFSGSAYSFEFKDVMEIAFCSIRNFGYRKSSEVGSTKSSICSYYGPNRKDFDINEEDIANAANAMVWIANNTSNNEFFINVKTIMSLHYIGEKYFGYVAGAAASYLKDLSRKNQEKVSFVSEYVGTIGKREDFTVKLINKMAIESYYGVSYLHIFLDAKGHKLSWFSSRDTDAEVDHEYVIKGTVKKHEIYKDIKQTSLSRVSFLIS